jgi:hypothetical protein
MPAKYEEFLNISYDGDGELIVNHSMDSQLVASSILALNSIYKEAFSEARKIYNDKLDVTLYLDANKDSEGFEKGSLKWLLRLVGLQSETQTNIENVVYFKKVQQAIVKIVEVLKRLHFDDAVIKITQTKDGYELEIDNENVLLDEIEYAILSNENIRVGLAKLSEPLLKDGIETFDLGSNSDGSFSINKEEAKNLYIKRSHKTILDEGQFEDVFYIETLSYNPEAKWKLISTTDKKKTISATIIDTHFLKRVSLNQEKFSKDDLLKARISYYAQKAKYTGKTVYTYSIIEILEHIPVSGDQGKLI